MTFSYKIENEVENITSNDIKYNFDTSILEEQRSVVRININGVDWFMDWNDFQKAKEERRTFPIIYNDKLIFVDLETAGELKKLEEWLKIKKQL